MIGVMARRLFTILLALSLVCCVGVSILWTRSYWRTDSFTFGSQPQFSCFLSERGFISLRNDIFFDPIYKTYYTTGREPVSIPHLFVVLAFLVLPISWWSRRPRGSGRRSGYCIQCGYDLRATPRRCPESGATASVKKPIR